MIIRVGCGIIIRMDISVLTTTGIEQLRALALAMVQQVVSEQAETEKLQQRILLLEESLKLARQQRFGKKGETLAGTQRSLFEEDVDADIAAVEAQLDKLLPVEEKAASARLPRVTQITNPPQPKAVLIARCVFW